MSVIRVKIFNDEPDIDTKMITIKYNNFRNFHSIFLDDFDQFNNKRCTVYNGMYFFLLSAIIYLLTKIKLLSKTNCY